MSAPQLSTAGRLRQRVRVLECLVALPALAVIAGYLSVLLDLSAADWGGLGTAIAIFAVAAGALVELTRRRRLQRVVAYLEAKAREERPARELCRQAFRSVIALPRAIMQQMMLIWGLAPLVIALLAWALGFEGFGLDARLLVMGVAGCLGAMISGSFVFFGSKRLLGDVRAAVAAEIADPVERAALASSTPLSRKLLLVVLGVVVGTSMLTVSLALSRASRSIDLMAADWQERMLAAIVTRAEESGSGEPASSLEAVLPEMLPDPGLLPFPSRFVEASGDTGGAAAAGLGRPIVARIERALAAGQQRGSVLGSGSTGVVSWQRTQGGRLLIAIGSEDAFAPALGAFHVALVLALLLSGGVSLGVSYLLADDFTRATRALCAEAERMAQGDLSRGRVWEAEDEMGGLGRAFERMASALRATVGRVAEAADRVDGAAGEIASISRSVAVANADQVRRIQQANELMLQIREQVAEVSKSAQALNVSVEESSSSILELGAAGEELNDTASVLSAKVDEVSGSIEQMVRSVKQVGATTEGLSNAAAETSSSMEEMASSMRAVDNTAAATARISDEVVSHSESGQLKVKQTIEGMEAIRDATDVAERVIRGLGARTQEIGGILDVIDDVADETNLLALNAAIIAAQAGEQGRAFSVVADEIKELADRVLASTKEIGGLIRAVQTESENAVGAIEAGSSSVASGVELSAQAGTALEEITRASRESGRRIAEIVAAVREQTRATSHVVALMETVREGVEQISLAGSEQDRGNEVVYRSAMTMREVAQQVRRTTEEQSRGFNRIRGSVEGVREAVESINGSLQEQSAACSQVASFLEQVFEGTRSNEEAAQRMGESMQDLLTQAQALRDDVARFRI